MFVDFAVRSHRGLVREGNEDWGAVAVWSPPGSQDPSARLDLFLVADGLGGHAGGEVASRIAVDALVAEFRRDAPAIANADDARRFFEDSVPVANAAVRTLAAGDLRLEGMGTTLTACLVTGSSLAVGHVGDSRAYLWRPAGLERLTRDHTMVQALVDRGEITAEEAREHPWRHMLSQSVGLADKLKVETATAALEDGAAILLCSDGLHGMIGDVKIEAALSSGKSPRKVCDRLVQEALDAGGRDNVTVLVGACWA